MAMTGYTQPLERVGFLNFTGVSGYTTMRIQVALPTGTTTSPATPFGTLVFQLENTGPNDITLQMKQSSAVSFYSGRTAIGAAQTIVAGGFTTVSAAPTQQIVEAWTTGGGPTNIRGQIVSRLDYTLMGFTQNGIDDPYYPPIFYAATLPPIL